MNNNNDNDEDYADGDGSYREDSNNDEDNNHVNDENMTNITMIRRNKMSMVATTRITTTMQRNSYMPSLKCKPKEKAANHGRLIVLTNVHRYITPSWQANRLSYRWLHKARWVQI